MRPLRDDLTAWREAALARSEALRAAPTVEEIGIVSRVGDGVASVTGLRQTRLDELLRFGAEGYGIAVTLERQRIGCVLLSAESGIRAGSRVERTGEVVRVPVGETLLGRVVDPLGRPLDDGPPIDAKRRDPIDKPAPAIVDRDLVARPLETGITVVDAMIPLGRGQRELIIGDRKTGKTALAVDAILSQKRSDVISVYVAVGQKASSINQVIDAVRRHGARDRTIFVVAAADSASGLQWIAPYAACTVAEYFSEAGRDALLVIDDLTKHAAVYREISLLLRHPPGREAYPGDIFYIHARLLERAAKLSPERGGGSLTALPIAETQAGNLTAYIPTNLISITDGQIYLDPKLFYEAQKPAVDVGKSVSRVGGKAQTPILKQLSARLRLEYAQFLELEVFTRFGTTVDERTRKAIEHGRRIRTMLVQPQLAPLRPAEEVALLLALDAGILDELSLEGVERFKSRLRLWLEDRCTELLRRIEASGELPEEERGVLTDELRSLARITEPTEASADHR